MRRILPWFRDAYLNLPLLKKMVVLYVFAIFLPILLLGTVYIDSVSQRLDAQYVQSKRGMLLQGVDAVSNKLEMVAFCTSSFQYNASLLEYIEHEDFSTAAGAMLFLSAVQPAFEQMRSANPDYDAICVYRSTDREQNDPRYVRNASEQLDLRELGAMSLKDMRMFLSVTEQGTTCRLYQALYNRKYYYQIGYMQVVYPFEKLFEALGFCEASERLVLELDGQAWQVERDGAGKLRLHADGGADALRWESAELEPLGARLRYGYARLPLFSSSELLLGAVGVLLLLVFFTAAYYLTYRPITKRITDFTRHMTCRDGLEPYPEDGNRDEIGRMIRRYNQTILREKQLIEENSQKERLVSQAQYYAMQSQIQPHFLYNTLENIDMLIAVGDNRTASRMIALFGKILRYNVSRNRELTTLGEEMDHITDYLRLYAFRMREDFHYHIELPEELRPLQCPYCMLQPVIENCFKHGFRQEDRELWIRLRAYRAGDAVEITVEDNGAGISPERMEELNRLLQGKPTEDKGAIGLRNVNDRVRLLCGEDCGLRIVPGEAGCQVRIRLKA